MYRRTEFKFLSKDKTGKNVKRLNIYSNIIPIYYLSKIVGLAPLSAVCAGEKETGVYIGLSSSVLGILYTVLFAMLLTGAYVCILVFNFKSSVRSESGKVYTSEVTMQVIFSIIILAVSTTKIRKEINKLLKRVWVLDELFHTPNEVLKRNEIFLLIQTVTLISIFCILILNYSFLVGSVSGTWMLCSIIAHICTLIEVVTAAQFVNLILLLKQKFQILNKYISPGEISSEQEANSNLWQTLLQTSCLQNVNSVLKETLEMGEFYRALTGRPYSDIQYFSCIPNQNCWFQKERLRFHALRVIHDVLCDMCESVNSMYGLQILLCMVSAFVGVASHLSYSIFVMNTNIFTYAQSLRYVSVEFFWALTHFLLLFCITGSCNAASGEADRSAVLLQKLLLTELHPATAAEVQLFLQQVINRKVKFTAWDFFTINCTVLGSIVGAITTLLAILVPFQTTN
jgi:hypothetical protein